MPARGLTALTLEQCEMGLKYENFRQQWFTNCGDNRRAMDAYTNAQLLFDRLEKISAGEVEQEEVTA